ncbi:MAG: putative repeat protein (TIGR03899 family) [Paraglaciecola sp.]|jgi:uncharacterized repeat protein (TIGR03899 family)
MKIQANPVPPSVNVKNPLAVAKTEKKTATKKPQLEKINKKCAQDRISQWFSQIGVNNTSSGLNQIVIDERLLQHQKMMAQRKLSNLENILGIALDFCLEDAKKENLDPDWFFSFVTMAEEIYSPAMQQLWGQIFAVETCRPGSFSLRSLQLLKQISQNDAHMFRTAVSLASWRKGEATPKLIFGYYQKSTMWSLFNIHKEHQLNLAEYGLGYPDLLSLMDLGLIHHSEIESGELEINSRVEWRCAGQQMHLSVKRRGVTLMYYKFTTTGAELFKLVSGHKHEAYVTELKHTLVNAFEID